MSDIKTRKFKCTGCGEARPCYLESNQEKNQLVDDLSVFDLKCVLDETNHTSYNWKEVSNEPNKPESFKDKTKNYRRIKGDCEDCQLAAWNDQGQCKYMYETKECDETEHIFIN